MQKLTAGQEVWGAELWTGYIQYASKDVSNIPRSATYNGRSFLIAISLRCVHSLDRLLSSVEDPQHRVIVLQVTGPLVSDLLQNPAGQLGQRDEGTQHRLGLLPH